MASNLLKDLDSDFLALEQRGRTQRPPGDPVDTSKYWSARFWAVILWRGMPGRLVMACGVRHRNGAEFHPLKVKSGLLSNFEQTASDVSATLSHMSGADL